MTLFFLDDKFESWLCKCQNNIMLDKIMNYCHDNIDLAQRTAYLYAESHDKQS